MRSGRAGQFRQLSEAPPGPLEEMSRARVIGFLLSRGRENEAVNIFAHRFLAARISASGPLRSLRQVGIEVAVPQVTGTLKSTSGKIW